MARFHMELRVVDNKAIMVKVYAPKQSRITHYTKVKGVSPKGGMYVAQQSTQICRCEVCGVKITRQQEVGGGRCAKH